MIQSQIGSCIATSSILIQLARYKSVEKVIIIGSRCAWLTAAIYPARADLRPIVFDGYDPGGQLGVTTLLENFPVVPDGILGPELVENARKQAQRFGTEFR